MCTYYDKDNRHRPAAVMTSAVVQLFLAKRKKIIVMIVTNIIEASTILHCTCLSIIVTIEFALHVSMIKLHGLLINDNSTSAAQLTYTQSVAQLNRPDKNFEIQQVNTRQTICRKTSKIKYTIVYCKPGLKQQRQDGISHVKPAWSI